MTQTSTTLFEKNSIGRNLYGIISVAFSQHKISSEFFGIFLNEFFAKEILGSGSGKYFYDFIVGLEHFSQRIHSHYNLTLHNNNKCFNCLQNQIMRQTMASSNNFHSQKTLS
jgi:hypothetical protein